MIVTQNRWWLKGKVNGSLPAVLNLKSQGKNIYSHPITIGFVVETSGHVSQLHFSYTERMNEQKFITETINKWLKGDLNFGFTHPVYLHFQKEREKLIKENK